MATSAVTDNTTPDARNLTQLIAKIKYVQLESELTLGERSGSPPSPADAQALSLMHKYLRAMAKKFIAENPGGSIAQFVHALSRGRAPSAGIPDDTNPGIQWELAQLISIDPSFLDF